MSQHVLSLKAHFIVFAVLMVLTFVTVAVASMDFGEWNFVIALSIAALKGTVVMLWFMHVKFSSKLTWLFASTGFVWLVILVVLLTGDYRRRGWVGDDYPLEKVHLPGD